MTSIFPPQKSSSNGSNDFYELPQDTNTPRRKVNRLD